MMSKAANKISRIFFTFLCAAMITGFLFLSVRNYIMPEVTVTKAVENGMLIKKYYFTGKVVPRNTIEVKADEKMYIKEVNVKNSQIAKPGTAIITFDAGRQGVSVNTEIAELKSRISEKEIERLNIKKQLDDAGFSKDKAEDAYNSAKEEYEKAAVLYENGAVTKEALDEKKSYMDTCMAEYESSSAALEEEKQIYGINITKIDDEVKALKSELQYETNSDTYEEYKITTDKNGVYALADRVYIDYVTDQPIVDKGDTVIKYSTYNTNGDMCIEAVLDREEYDDIFKDKGELYFWKSDEKKKTRINAESVRVFPDHNELVFGLDDSLKESIYVTDIVKFIAQSEEKCDCVVDKTTVVPIGDLRTGSYCYIYTVETENSILGETKYLREGKYKILAVGDSTVSVEAAESAESLAKKIDKDSVIVNFASSVLEDKMKVRVVN